MNGCLVEGESHSRVIELIKQNPEKLRMVLMSVPRKENERLDGEAVSYCSEDDFDIRKIDITIPSISHKEEGASKYVVYNVYVNGNFQCSHRYNAFYNLQTDLRNKFYQFEFPKFPGKWPFQLSNAQLEKRHKELEQWLMQVCSVTQIFDHFYMQDFLGLTKAALKDRQDSTNSAPENTSLKVYMKDGTLKTVNVPTVCKTKTVIDAMCEELSIPPESAQHFGLYVISDEGFEELVNADVNPVDMYIQIYNSENRQPIKFVFKKFLFSPKIEDELMESVNVLPVLYQEAIMMMDKLDISGKEIELNRNQHTSTCREFVKIAQSCPGYNEISFPHCQCDSRQDGHVILTLSAEKISIRACTVDGERQDQVKKFQWSTITDYGIDSENMEEFFFKVNKNGNERKLVLISSYSDYMKECFAKILKEVGDSL